MPTAQFANVALAGRIIKLEVRWIFPDRKAAPLVIFLHEGLGSVATWGDWPDKLCDTLQCRGLVYSRPGYGQSTTLRAGEEWPLRYLEAEAVEVLPALLHALGIDAEREPPILFGHSDGGTIALLHAAAYPKEVGAVVAVAPHVIVEEIGVRRIEQLARLYEEGSLREKLAGFHSDPDGVFHGWSSVWRSDGFRPWDIRAVLCRIACPVLAVQGVQDQYGTAAQVETVARLAPAGELIMLEECRHVPHQDQPERLSKAVKDFVSAVGRSSSSDVIRAS